MTTMTFCWEPSSSRTRYEAAGANYGQVGRGAAAAVGCNHQSEAANETRGGPREKTNRRGAPENPKGGILEVEVLGRKRRCILPGRDRDRSLKTSICTQ